MIKFAVRWTDQDGKRQRKEYNDQRTAYKALKWVIDNGGVDADVAVLLPKKPEKVVD